MNKEEIKKRLKHRETYYKQVGEVAKELLELLGTVEEVFNEPIYYIWDGGNIDECSICFERDVEKEVEKRNAKGEKVLVDEILGRGWAETLNALWYHKHGENYNAPWNMIEEATGGL